MRVKAILDEAIEVKPVSGLAGPFLIGPLEQLARHRYVQNVELVVPMMLDRTRMTMVNLTECGPYRSLMQALLVALVLCGSACTPPRNLRKVELVSACMDSVRVRITGTVMLDGGCSGDRPLWALEQRTDSGWVERVPFPGAQHLCGPGSWRWPKREVLIPLRDEVLHGLRATDHVLAPGMYRLVFMGSGGKRKATREFEL